MKSRRNTLRYGFYSFLGIASFFLVMKLFGLEDISALRVFNIVIVVYFTNRLAHKNLQDEANLDYPEALASLFLANVLTVALSVITFIAYVKFIDVHFLDQFKGGVLWTDHINLLHAIASLLMEGLAGSVVISFITMQYWKDVKVKNNKPHGAS